MALDPTKQYFTKYTNERLGSAFTGSNSAVTVTERLENISSGFDSYSAMLETYFDDQEEVIARAVNELEDTKLDKIVIDDYYTKDETSGATELANEFNKFNDRFDDYYTKDETSGATQLSDTFGSGFTVSSITDALREDEEVIAKSLVDLKNGKLDITAFNAFIEELTEFISNKELTIAASLTDLDDRLKIVENNI